MPPETDEFRDTAYWKACAQWAEIELEFYKHEHDCAQLRQQVAQGQDRAPAEVQASLTKAFNELADERVANVALRRQIETLRREAAQGGLRTSTSAPASPLIDVLAERTRAALRGSVLPPTPASPPIRHASPPIRHASPFVPFGDLEID